MKIENGISICLLIVALLDCSYAAPPPVISSRLRKLVEKQNHLLAKELESTGMSAKDARSYKISVSSMGTAGMRNDVGMTPLIQAAKSGSLEIVQNLIDSFAFVDDIDQFGKTALIYASEVGYYEIVNALLEAGADPNYAPGPFSEYHVDSTTDDEYSLLDPMVHQRYLALEKAIDTIREKCSLLSGVPEFAEDMSVSDMALLSQGRSALDHLKKSIKELEKTVNSRKTAELSTAESRIRQILLKRADAMLNEIAWINERIADFDSKCEMVQSQYREFRLSRR